MLGYRVLAIPLMPLTEWNIRADLKCHLGIKEILKMAFIAL